MAVIEIHTESTTDSPEVDQAELSCNSDSEDAETNSVAQIEARKNPSRKAAFDDFLKHDVERLEALLNVENSKRNDESRRVIDQARGYQEELFELAKESNVIAVLDTGSGKTLIAALLMKWMAQQELVDRANGKRHRVAFFLVNSQHLVRQQARFLASNLADPPCAIYGSGKFDVSRQGWRKLVENNTAIPALRPKIFGMTASPIHTKGNVQKAIENLETFLHSKIVTTPDMTLLAFAPKARNVLWEYEKLQVPFETDLYRKVFQLCDLVELEEFFTYAKFASSQLGPWMSDQIWLYVLGSDRELTKTMQRLERSREYQNMGSSMAKAEVIRSLQDASQVVKAHDFRRPTTTSQDLSSKTLLLLEKLSIIFQQDAATRCIVFVERRWTALMLASCCNQLKISNLRPGVLLGVNQTGPVIDQLETSPKNQETMMEHFRAGFINCMFATNVAEEGIDIPQCSVVVRFDLFKSPIQYMQSRGRARMQNSIFAMMIEAGNRSQRQEIDYSVETEEYIKEICQNLPPDRLLGNSSSAFAKLRALEAIKKSFVTSSGASCNYGNSRSILARYAGSLQYEGNDVSEPSYQISIKEDNLEGSFRYKVTLVEGSKEWTAWGDACQKKYLAKSSAAWKLCAILRSQKPPLLDENLESVHVRRRPDGQSARLRLSEEKKHKYVMKVKPNIWNEGLGKLPTILYVTLLSLVSSQELDRPHAPLLFLTRQPLVAIPAFKVYLGPEKTPTDAIFRKLRNPINMDQDMLQLLTDYTLEGIFADVFNKVYEKDVSRMPYWLAPASLKVGHAKRALPSGDLSLEEFEVDYQGLVAIQDGRKKWKSGDSASQWCNNFLGSKYAVDPKSGKYHYFTYDTIPGANIDSPIPASAMAVPLKGKASILDWTDSLWKQSKKNLMNQRDYDQPVLAAKLILTRRSFLDVSDESLASIECHICPQPLEVSPLEPAHAATALVWPAIIYRLESYLITLEAFQKLDLQMPPDLALEAFTKDSNTGDQENQTHTGDLRGMGKNYERLEFIGDSLLKMMTTIMVYVNYSFDEFSLHVTRMSMLSNLNLFNVAAGELELFQYVRTSSFNRNTWYPEHLVLLKGRGVQKPPGPVKHKEMTHDLSQKTIADVSEAIIGAALISQRHLPSSLKFDLSIKAVTQLVSSKDHDIHAWSEILPRYKAPAWSLLKDDPIANDLAVKVRHRTGYAFKNPRLLRSAMTHSSDQLSTVPDLQRLEFLGDAILDMVCINWMFEKYPDRNPQWLTEHKMAMVSNRFLAALAVDLSFDKFMFTTAPAVVGQCSKYAFQIREQLERGKRSLSPDFWLNIPSPPKALSDLVESYIGAVFVDSGFEYAQIESFFTKHMLWYFDNIELYDSFANRHPTSYVHRRLTVDYGCMDYKILCSDPVPGDDGQPLITAGVMVHDKVLASSRAASGRYAKLRASKAGVIVLEGLTIGQFREKFGCDCRRREGHEPPEEVEEVEELREVADGQTTSELGTGARVMGKE